MEELMEEHNTLEEAEYMNKEQLAYFTARLITWRNNLTKEEFARKKDLQTTVLKQPDLFDTATKQMGLVMDINDLMRQRTLIGKIDKALQRIESGEYGYCEVTGEEIGVKRLKAHPIATMCVEIQELVEQRNKKRNSQYLM